MVNYGINNDPIYFEHNIDFDNSIYHSKQSLFETNIAQRYLSNIYFKTSDNGFEVYEKKRNMLKRYMKDIHFSLLDGSLKNIPTVLRKKGIRKKISNKESGLKTNEETTTLNLLLCYLLGISFDDNINGYKGFLNKDQPLFQGLQQHFIDQFIKNLLTNDIPRLLSYLANKKPKSRSLVHNERPKSIVHSGILDKRKEILANGDSFLVPLNVFGQLTEVNHKQNYTKYNYSVVVKINIVYSDSLEPERTFRRITNQGYFFNYYANVYLKKIAKPILDFF